MMLQQALDAVPERLAGRECPARGRLAFVPLFLTVAGQFGNHPFRHRPVHVAVGFGVPLEVVAKQAGASPRCG